MDHDLNRQRRYGWGAAGVAGSTIAARPLAAQSRVVVVRDAEIENSLHTMGTPAFRAASLDPSAVSVHIVLDKNLNAFVAGGQRIFLHTGLIARTDTANQIIGVMAHETGHISGGHLARLQERLNTLSVAAIIEALATGGLIAAGATRGGVGGGGAAPGGPSISERIFLQYTQGEEQSADQAAVNFLTRTGQSPRGMVEVLRILQQQERIVHGYRPDPYLRTHPINTQRISFLEDQIQKSRFANAPDSPANAEAHRRMLAKTLGYLDPPEALRKFPDSDRSIAGRYARAWAYYRSGSIPVALSLCDQLIRENPRDPYFYELKAQTLYENQRVAEAVPLYERAVALLPGRGNEILRFELARAQLGMNRPDMDREAVRNLEAVSRFDDRNPEVWRNLSMAYNRTGNQGMTYLALAEERLSRGQGPTAIDAAERALKLLPQGSPGWLRADDIRLQARRIRRP
jgi:predicted Zn-dependent protease